ncbi:NifB/NifX family molybdenum-iron cluster-binding protein [Desulfoplanes sp. PS50]
MKIAVPSTTSDLDGVVSSRLGMADHLLVVETEDMSFEAVPGPPRSSGPGAGIMAVSLAVNMGARVILVGHVAPHIADALKKQGIDVVTQVTGTVSEAVSRYLEAGTKQDEADADAVPANAAPVDVSTPAETPWARALKQGLRQFYALLPRLVGVVLLLGLVRGLVSQKALFALFPGRVFLDSLWGATIGSVLAGNPVNSYVIARGLLDAGVGLAAVTALMLSWVSVGVIQMPAESAALGIRFTLVRNVAGFVMAAGMSLGVIFWPGGGI